MVVLFSLKSLQMVLELQFQGEKNIPYTIKQFFILCIPNKINKFALLLPSVDSIKGFDTIVRMT